MPAPPRWGDALDPLLFESGYLAAPYPKLFRLDVIRRNKLRFDPRLKINEDVLFNLQYLRFLLFLQKTLPFIALQVYTIIRMICLRAVCPAPCGGICWTPRL